MQYSERKNCTCPRRLLQGFGGGEGKDGFEHNRGMVTQPIGCTFCGSLPGDVFMEWAKTGCIVDGSDKSYKFYIDGPNGEWAKFYTPHLNRAQAKEFLDLWLDQKITVRLYVAPWLPSLSDEAPSWLAA